MLVTDGDEAYRAVVTRAYMDNGETYVDVKYDNVPGFTTNVEKGVELHRLTLIYDVNTHARAMEAVRASTWARTCDRVSKDIGPQPYYTPRNRPDKRKLYTYQQAMQLAQPPKRKRKRVPRGEDDKGEAEKGGEEANKGLEKGEASKGGKGDKGGKGKDKKKQRTNKKPKLDEKELSEAELLKKFADLDLTRHCPYCKHRGKRFMTNATGSPGAYGMA